MTSTLMPLLRTKATPVWGVLIAATIVSWWLGTDHGLGSDDHQVASTLILLVAFIKVRFIGLYFMDLRDAPIVLRALFEGYCIAVCTLVLGMYLGS